MPDRAPVADKASTGGPVRRLGVIGLGAMATIALAGCGGSPSFPTGTDTATITWHRVDGTATATGPQPFSGTVAGIPVRGDAALEFPSRPSPGGLPTLPPRGPFARWTGSFEGHRFSLLVSCKHKTSGE